MASNCVLLSFFPLHSTPHHGSSQSRHPEEGEDPLHRSRTKKTLLMNDSAKRAGRKWIGGEAQRTDQPIFSARSTKLVISSHVLAFLPISHTYERFLHLQRSVLEALCNIPALDIPHVHKSACTLTASSDIKSTKLQYHETHCTVL